MRALRARRRRGRVLAVMVVVVGVAVATGAAFFVAPGAGSLNTSLHQHPHIEIYVRGELVPISVNIGINPALYNDHSFDEFGEMGGHGHSPLHTHESDGTIHMELSRWTPLTLGNFFSVWGQPFGPNQVLDFTGSVTMSVNGAANGEFGALILQDGQRIVIRGG